MAETPVADRHNEPRYFFQKWCIEHPYVIVAFYLAVMVLGSITIFGGVEGQYIPEPLVVYNLQEYRVPGFRWREDRPTMEKMGIPWKKNEHENM